MKVRITKAMRQKARREARKRYEFKRQHTRDHKSVQPTKAIQHETTGILAEMVVGKLIGLEPDFKLYARAAGFDWDFDYRGLKLDIKGSSNPRAENLILFPEETQKDVDVFVAVTIEPGWAYVRGYATKRQMASTPVTLWLYGPRRLRSYLDLSPFQELLPSRRL